MTSPLILMGGAPPRPEPLLIKKGFLSQQSCLQTTREPGTDNGEFFVVSRPTEVDLLAFAHMPCLALNVTILAYSFSKCPPAWCLSTCLDGKH